jgi:acyl-CoA dehydrogenase
MSAPRATSDELAMIESVADGIFSDHGARDPVHALRGAADGQLWETLRQSGFTRIGTAEEACGDGGSLPEAATVVRVAARWAAPIPLAEAVLVGYPSLAQAGISAPVGGMLTAGLGTLRARQVADGWALNGMIDRVAFGAAVGHIVAPALSDGGSPVLAVLPVPDLKTVPGRNLADEPRDSVAVDTVVPGESAAGITPELAEEFRLRGALSRSVLIVGGLDALVPLAVRHATTRHQFGRPLSAFQAVQHHVVVAAAEAAAARAAVDAAVEACQDGFAAPGARLAVAAAKIRTAQAAGVAAAAAHQVHGAIGMTREHELHLITTRLWSWRAEWGGEAAWARELGRMALAADTGLWDLLVNADQG